MNSKIQLLGIIAALQLLIVGLFMFSAGEDTRELGPWLDFAPRAVDELEISDSDETIRVHVGESGWEIDGLPADEDKIQNLLDKLSQLDGTWPVATTDDAIERFEVANDNFQRHLIAKSGGATVVDVYLGSAPDYQKVHARRASDSEVFSVALSNYELSANVDGWLDKGLLTVFEDPSSIVAQIGDEQTSLRKSDEFWLVNGGPADQSVVATYANRFKTMQVLGVYQGNRTLELSGVIAVGDPVERRLEILREEGEGEYVIRSDSFTRTFRLSTYIAEQLLMTDIELRPQVNVSSENLDRVEEIESEEEG